ncbi:hypothetical protein [Ralstonia chuxiongensis]|uniref:Uncharacterized protein n=1 Tax=Ralstonia chuxiongensis TaxID=2957504 RepID=A0AA41WUR8_9RALS|nr:hypothetical protein [Ralstonia chuxiongensis]MCP1173647.1 hypothetical protein [Ralstonia chuxiongensis]
MIPTRVGKLKFIVEEMQLAFHLAMHVTDPFVARTLARHILVRAENFIEHARGLRKPLKNAGHDIRDFHKTKEAYASAFEEYFQVARHKLGAHVQDFDFGKRIELWNEIEIVKIGYFVDGALQIYRSLAALSLPGYVTYAEPTELTDPSVLESLGQFQQAINNGSGIEMGTDPLAMTRNNTSAVLNMTPVHQRAGQLALIRRWIAMQREILRWMGPQIRIARILKARIVTDLVSFCDCLVTRTVPPGALQEMEGLDKLIVASGQSSATIDNFVAASNFQAELQVARTIRDKIGAHLEISDSYTLAGLSTDLDTYDLVEGLNFYGRVGAAFTKTCHSILFLRLYAADGQRLHGVSAAMAPAAPYAGNSIEGPPAPPTPLPIDDVESYRTNLARWLDSNDERRAEASHFFGQAFLGSQVIETLDEVERFGAGQRSPESEFRKAHGFLLSTLVNGISDFDFQGVLELVLSCRNGSPYPLAELLVRYGSDASEFRQWWICSALGEIGSAPHATVSQFLETRTYSRNWPIRFQATLARFKTFVKAEGTFRLNHKGQTRVDYDTFVGSLTTSMTEFEQFVCVLAFASILSGPRVGSLSSPFHGNYAELQKKIEALIVPLLKDDSDKGSKRTTLHDLIQTNDYVGVCVLVAIELGDQHPWHTVLVDCCCNGSIADAGHDQAARHLAMCFLLRKEHHLAYEIVEGIASRSPDWVDIQVLAAEILGETPEAEEQAKQRISSIRRTYKLTSDLDARLCAIETEIEKR